MNKLLKEFLSYILTEARAKREIGAVWQTAKGWSAKRADRTQGGFKDKASAEAWLSGKGKAPGEETPTGAGGKETPPETDTTTTKTPSADTQPTATDLDTRDAEKTQSGMNIFTEPVVTPGGNKILGSASPESFQSALKQISDKVVQDVPLSEMSPEVKEEYTSRGIVDENGTAESNDQFLDRMEAEGYTVTRPFVELEPGVRDSLRAAGVPEHHIQLIERCLNIKRKGKNPPISSITLGAAGAGTNTSQVGEVTALALMALPPDQRDAAAKELERISLANSGCILEPSWVQAARNQAEAFTASMDARYGTGNWSVETTAWDTPSDISSIGLSEEDKGFSTDVVVRITVNGESRATRISLKKDGDVYVLNGAANDVNTYSLQTLEPEERKEYDELSTLRRKLTSGSKEEKAAARAELKQRGITPNKDAIDEKLREIEQKAFERLPPETQKALTTIREYPSRQQASSDKMATSVGEPMSDTESAVAGKTARERNPDWKDADEKFARDSHAVISKVSPPKTPEKIREALIKAGVIDKEADSYRKAVLYAAELEATRNPDMSGLLEQHYAITTEAENAYFDGLLGSEQLMTGLMVELERQFPIEVISTGTESMMVGGVPVDDETLSEMFGTTDREEIRRGMRIVERDGKRVLIYTARRADGTSEEIPLATVECRERGQGYRGNMTVGYKMAPQFVCRAAEANQRRNAAKTPPISNPANDAVVNKCSGKKGKRGK